MFSLILFTYKLFYLYLKILKVLFIFKIFEKLMQLTVLFSRSFNFNLFGLQIKIPGSEYSYRLWRFWMTQENFDFKLNITNGKM